MDYGTQNGYAPYGQGSYGYDPNAYPQGGGQGGGYMEGASLRQEIARRQKKLIPVNIAVMLLCLVAALSLLFLPLLSVDMSDPSVLESMMGTGSSDGSGGEDGSGSTDGSGEESGADDPMALVLQNIDLKLSFTGMDLITVGFADDAAGALLAQAGGILADSASAVAAGLVAAVVQSSAEQADTELDVQPLEDALHELEAAENDAEADAAIAALVAEAQSQLGADVLPDDTAADVQAALREQYDRTVAETQDGKFTAEAFVCVAISSAMSESGDGQVCTDFSALVEQLLGGEEGLIPPEAESMLKTVFFVVACLSVFFAAVWAILFLFAFFRLFAKNKRFTMWYVKIFGILPCLLFGVVPLVVGAILGGEVAATIGMLSTLAWVSGGCWVVLWLVSIFWAFPIKRKIRRLNKQLKQLGQA